MGDLLLSASGTPLPSPWLLVARSAVTLWSTPTKASGGRSRLAWLHPVSLCPPCLVGTWRHVQWGRHCYRSLCVQEPYDGKPVGGPGLLRLHGAHAVHVADNLHEHGHTEGPR